MTWKKWLMIAVTAGALLLLVSTVKIKDAPAQSASWPLAWTVPTDNVGVTTYKMFWSAATPDTTGLVSWENAGALPATMPAGILAWTNNANNMNGPVPLLAGSAQTFSIPFTFAAAVKYYSMVKSCDAAGNCSYSNFATRITQTVDTLPPKPITDLRTAP